MINSSHTLSLRVLMKCTKRIEMRYERQFMNTIKGTSKHNWATQALAKSLTCLALLLCMISLVSCRQPKRAEVNARIWLNNAPIPIEICLREPELERYGFYRKLNDGSFEFISFCSTEASHWVAMFEDDFKDLMDKYVPKAP